MTKFATLVGGVDSMRAMTHVASLLAHLNARNIETGATNSLADFGFGLSQCLPIFIQGVMHTPGQLLIVEQPEAQLHPTAQFELASFFAELWTRRQVPCIVETHSANIILRLRRMVKEGKLKPDDISIAYFAVDSVSRPRGSPYPAVTVKNLDVNQDGSLARGLPMEFFGADVIEAIEMGAT